MICFNTQKEAENAVEILGDLVHNKTYENENSRIFRNEVPKAKIKIERK